MPDKTTALDTVPCIKFTVFGQAKPSGSKRAFIIKGRAIVTDANANSRDWKNAVSSAAAEHFDGPLLDCPLCVRLRFVVPRPKGHFNSRGELNKAGAASRFPAKKPDLLKLARSIEDSMSGIVFRDDCLIVDEHLQKFWGEPARVEIEIWQA